MDISFYNFGVPSKPSYRKRSRSAFTLIEILLVVAILATMTGIMAPRMNSAYKNLEIQAATQELEETIRYAAQNSIRRRKRIELNIDPAGGTYWLEEVNAGRGQFLGEELAARRLRETLLPEGIRAEITPVNDTTGLIVKIELETSLVFYPDGRRDTGLLKVTDSRDRSKWISVGRTLGTLEITNQRPEESDGLAI